MATDLFISYAWGAEEVNGVRPLQEKALFVAARLKALGFSVWLDIEKMPSAATGDSGDLNTAMASGISAASAVVVLLSSSYASSSNCQKEFSYAVKRKKPVFFVNVGDPPNKAMDSRGWDPDSYDDADPQAVAVNGWLSMAVGQSLWADCRSKELAEGPGGLAQLTSSLRGNGKVRCTGPVAPPPTPPPPAALKLAIGGGGGGGGCGGKEEEEEEEEECKAGSPRCSKEAEDSPPGSPLAAGDLQAAAGAAVGAMVSQNAGLAERACHDLSLIAHASPDACLSAGAVHALVAVLTVHCASAPTVSAAALAIKNIAVGALHRKAACLEALPALAHALVMHASAAGAAEALCGALKNIASGEGTGAADICLQCGAVGALIGVLAVQRNRGLPELLGAASGALRNVCAAGDSPSECRALCRSEGALGATLAALAAHPRDTRVVVQVCGLLRAITWEHHHHHHHHLHSSSGSSVNSVGAVGGAPGVGADAAGALPPPISDQHARQASGLLVEALKVHGSTDAAVAEQACGALWNLLVESGSAKSPRERCEASIAAGVVPLLQGVLASHCHGSAVVCEQALGLFSALAFNSCARGGGGGGGAGGGLAPAAALPAILTAWGSHIGHGRGSICELACKLLEASAASSEAFRAACFAAPSAFPALLIKTIAAHAGTQGPTEWGLRALLTCSGGEEASTQPPAPAAGAGAGAVMPEWRERCTAAGLAEALCGLLSHNLARRHHPTLLSSHARAHELALRALRALTTASASGGGGGGGAAAGSSEAARRAVAAGALEHLPHTLQRFSSGGGGAGGGFGGGGCTAATSALAPLVCMHAAAALSSLCFGSEERKSALCGSGSGSGSGSSIFPALVGALTAHAAHAACVESVAGAMAGLAGGSDSRKDACMAAGAGPALALALSHLAPRAPTAAPACENAAVAVAVLAYSSGAHRATLAACGILAHLTAILTRATLPSALDKAAQAVCILASGSVERRAVAVAAGAVRALVGVFGGAHGPQCRESAKMALKHLGFSEEGAPLAPEKASKPSGGVRGSATPGKP